ncbi:pyruvate kinase [Veillonella caviae]|uniref:pyruvate kinase n=1 Tax=Veillonella caviae TaxID=248316 RepID=UPI0023F76769|nr:pyruvate kinase [Veillonella caviae]MCI7692933.1 pyruvate kinase [Veillonella caviae]MDD7291345.1 pyruvate kinase [Veillonella caviae]MDY5254239.1 pyruvate kinase [Veillonella caviae]MDY5787774.1 pyruvate kinase [Veillonella caviae]
MKRTKIVCTVGPGTDKPGILENMMRAGMNVARFNFSHGTHDEQLERMQMVRDAAMVVNKPIALMLDTKGPEVRLGLFKDGKVFLKAGQNFTLTTDDVEGSVEISSVNHKGLVKDVSVGDVILLADGLVTLHIDKIEGNNIITTVVNSGEIGNRKRVAVPGGALSLPPVSEQDEEDLRFGCRQGIDFVAASFMQRGKDVVAIRRILESEQKDVKIIAKIENAEGVKNIDEILDVADGLMVARGDLGVEIPAEEVPVLQKMMIEKCNHLGKPVITATQMLESMIQNPRPTRAEASDVANAILDGTDAIMLSGETANGAYPVEAVETMTRIAEVTEQSVIYDHQSRTQGGDDLTTTDAVCLASVRIARDLKAAAILTCTESGHTAISVARHRPNCKIIAVTPHDETIRRMQLCWGVQAIKGQAIINSDEMVKQAIAAALGAGVIESGDLVVVTAGVPSGSTGTTNMIRVHIAGQVLLSGNGILRKSVTGNVFIAANHKGDYESFKSGDILVVGTMEPDLMSVAKRAGGIIAVEDGYTSDSAIAGITYGIPVILGAKMAHEVLLEGQEVTIDGERGKVFAGIANAR